VGQGDLSGYTTFSLRAAVDPLSPLNAPGHPQAFTLQLTDRAGNRTAVPTRPDEPALAFPAGLVEEDDFSGGWFTGPAPMTTIRWTLSDFDGVDLADIGEIALLFDRTPSGSLFLGDLEWARPSQPEFRPNGMARVAGAFLELQCGSRGIRSHAPAVSKIWLTRGEICVLTQLGDGR
jgi:hypothetical protein